MFTKAKIKLTLLYSGLFFLFFWLFSAFIYIWMIQSLGAGYISKVRERHERINAPGNLIPFNKTQTEIVTMAGEVAITQLKDILIFVNIVFLIAVPTLAWMYANQTLSPVQEAHEKQKQFVSDASHELRTPLSIMSCEIELMLKHEQKPTKYIRALKNNKEEIDHMKTLIENLLYLARDVEKNTIQRREPVDLTDLISTLIMSLKPEYKAKQITVSFTPDEDAAVSILGNFSLIRQLFLNIIHNAIQYTPEKGTIDIKVGASRQYAIVRISDSGIGISPADQKKIFDRFYRNDTSRSNRKGYGLGLSIVQKIVHEHNGKIMVQSQLGKGTTFIIQLPKHG